MENLSMRYVFDRKHKATATVKGLLQIEVRLNGTSKKKFISTGVKLFRGQFSERNGFTCINHPNSQLLTGKGRAVFNKVEAFVFSDYCRTFEQISDWNKSPSETCVVVEFIELELRRMNASRSTIDYHNSLITRLRGFGRIVTFSDLTYSNIADFDSYLRQYIKSQPVLYKRHTALKRMIEKAQRRKLCDYNPYDEFEVKKGQSAPPTYLTEGEVRKIMDFTPTIERLQNIKDLFIFQCYTGLAYADMMRFNRQSIIRIDGYDVFRNGRKKTRIEFVTLLLPQAEEILNKYDYHLPQISNQKYNDYLKLLACGAGISKRLTTHVARHTFATYLVNRGIPIESVSKAMGHANIRMTEHYARIFNSKVVSDMSALLNNK